MMYRIHVVGTHSPNRSLDEIVYGCPRAVHFHMLFVNSDVFGDDILYLCGIAVAVWIKNSDGLNCF
jgi:hypothetical protein